MSNEQRARLGDVADITVGHVGPMASEYVDNGIPFLRSQNVKPHWLDLRDVKLISREFHARLRKSSLRPGDVVVVRTGTPGASAVVPSSLTEANCADLLIVRPSNSLDSHFLSYYINGAAGFVSSRTVGAVQQHFNVASARDLMIPDIPLADQQKVSRLLRALDDKITANERIAATAQGLSRSLISEDRWTSRCALAELVDIKRSHVNPSALTNETVALFSLPAYDSGQTPELVLAGTIKSGKFLIEESAVLLSKLNPLIPRVWQVDPNDEFRSLASTEFLVLGPRPGVSTADIWAICGQPSFLTTLAARATGTSNSHQRIGAKETLDAEVVDPRLCDQRTRVAVGALSECVQAARKDSLVLANLRDTLLPRLLSGKIRIKDAEPIVVDAV